MSQQDIIVDNHGSIMIFQPLTAAGQEWIDENVQSEDWQWIGGGLSVEARYAGDLAQGMRESGLSVA